MKVPSCKDLLPMEEGILPACAPGEFVFAGTHLDHGHIAGQVIHLKAAGATLRYVYDADPERARALVSKHPEASVATSFEEILDDPEVRLVTSAAVPDLRASVGFQVLRAGKDYFTDKCPFTSLEQLAEARKIVGQTGRRYLVNYGERIGSEMALHAVDLIRRGVIGRVLHVTIMGPHLLRANTRPDWFFQKARYGGILTDIASHQMDFLLACTGAGSGEVLHARVDNLANPEFPELEDFGEASVRLDDGTYGHCRVDWLTPAGLSTWGDGRTFITGTNGSMELRKNLDLTRGLNPKLLVVNDSGEHDVPCSGETGNRFYPQMIRDILEGTEKAMTQSHAFLAAELSLRAQSLADRNRAL